MHAETIGNVCSFAHAKYGVNPCPERLFRDQITSSLIFVETILLGALGVESPHGGAIVRASLDAARAANPCEQPNRTRSQAIRAARPHVQLARTSSRPVRQARPYEQQGRRSSYAVRAAMLYEQPCCTSGHAARAASPCVTSLPARLNIY